VDRRFEILNHWPRSHVATSFNRQAANPAVAFGALPLRDLEDPRQEPEEPPEAPQAAADTRGVQHIQDSQKPLVDPAAVGCHQMSLFTLSRKS
jgi:hypothetical protein